MTRDKTPMTYQFQFESFPPVFSIFLQRYTMDDRGGVHKWNEVIEFPTTLKVDKFVPGTCSYALHSVTTHEGQLDSGHYRTYIRPKQGTWYKFDDAVVTECSEYDAVQANYG